MCDWTEYLIGVVWPDRGFHLVRVGLVNSLRFVLEQVIRFEDQHAAWSVADAAVEDHLNGFGKRHGAAYR